MSFPSWAPVRSALTVVLVLKTGPRGADTVVELGEAQLLPGAGGKAQTLSDLVAAGFDVPEAFVVASEAFRVALGERAGQVQAVLDALSDDVALAAGQLVALTADLMLPAEVAAAVAGRLDPEGAYAVRSSGLHEDDVEHSSAGLHDSYLDVTAAEVPARIMDCYRSSFSVQALAYQRDRGLVPAVAGLGVIVQRMVRADVAGVAFSVDPVTGADTHVVIEATAGLGDEMVAGRDEARRTVVDWYAGRVLADAGLLSAAERTAVVDLVLAVQTHLGLPCDVEWAIEEGELHLLQARPVTRVQQVGLEGQWTTANFKDGGVSAGVCTPLMWSLYERVWQSWLSKFLVGSRLVTPEQGRTRLGRLFYSRPYWNLSLVKVAMAKAPGYVEREFDAELGVGIAYDGPGTTTRLTPRSLAEVGRVALVQRRWLREMERDVEGINARLVAVAQAHERALAAGPPDEVLHRLVTALLSRDVLHSQGWYFWQIFINTIHQQLAREAIVKAVGAEAYVDLIGGLEDVSHLRPFRDAWALSRRLREDPYWVSASPSQVVADLRAGVTAHGLDEVRAFVGLYGHHSAKELDLSHPDFSEDPAPLVAMVTDAVRLDDEYGPDADVARRSERYQAALATAASRMSPTRHGRFVRRVERMRRLLWWREELRDTSTRMLHVTRLATLELGRRLTTAGVLDAADDVWFATADDLVAYLAGGLRAETLRERISRDRTYYLSFRHFHPDDELGQKSAAPVADPLADEQKPVVTGIPASNGTVTGTARVITSFDEVDRLQPGDVLVTRFTDPGWAGRFGILGGLVTETGGVLCHAAVVAREYGIPCVVAAPAALRRIPDGAVVRLDGGTGKVAVLDLPGTNDAHSGTAPSTADQRTSTHHLCRSTSLEDPS